MMDSRPNPDVLLLQANEEERQSNRGKLKIYLGAAPGVGKTYKMLSDAILEQNKGVDVLVGVVESHARKEIEAKLSSLEILPKINVDYHGKVLHEFDLDAALKRNPGLILIDEMAHSNAPFQRHNKRWQDIKELLDRKINVYTTLNVQHIESLNDDVTQIIHAPIRETIPDSMLEIADVIEFVDLPPDDLIARLYDGKVYIPQQIEMAADEFFRKGNLSALRELALRVVTKHVGAQVLMYRHDQGIKHIWPTSNKILVCVSDREKSYKLIRVAKQLVTSSRADWIAVYVDILDDKNAEEKRNRAIGNLRFAEYLGAETRIITGFNVVDEVMNFAREQNVTQIMVCKHIRKKWRDFFAPALADQIVRRSAEIDVYIMTSDEKFLPPTFSFLKITSSYKAYLLSVSMVMLATLVDFIFKCVTHTNNFIMIYLLGVMLISLLGRMGPAILASFLSVFAYAFFFIEPVYSLDVKKYQYLPTLIVMLIVAQVISQLTIRAKRQANLAKSSERQVLALYQLTKKLSSTRGLDNILDTSMKYIAEIFDCEVMILIPEGRELVMRPQSSLIEPLTLKEQGIADWVFELGQKAGLGTDSLSFSKALYVPLQGLRRVVGVLRMIPLKNTNQISPEKMQLLDAITNQVALSMEVDALQETNKNKEVETATDRARSALLQAVSHDLRSPIAAIMGAASTQIEMAKQLDANAIDKLGQSIYFETDQLGRLINNLLQITYLEANQITLQKKLSSMQELVADVLKSMNKKLQDRIVNTNIPKSLPFISFDQTLLQEVLINLIDNAVKFTPPHTAIEIFLIIDDEKMTVSILDHGPGIRPDEENKLFEKFYRGRMLTTERGLGLGLAICKIIIEAHEGKIWVENVKDGGARFSFILLLDKE